MKVAAIWRHPIKAIGRERIAEAVLEAGRALPGDRVWAVAHEDARLDGDGWAHCRNFARGAAAPSLMAVELARSGDRLRLTHPDRPELIVDPDESPETVAQWIVPLVPEQRSRPVRVVRAGAQAWTDSAFPSVSIAGLSSLRALSDKVGAALSPDRFRANLWVDNTGPWEEFDWVGRTIRVGEAELRIEERIVRCKATTANPETGCVDADTLGALEEGWGHREFGVYAVVTKGGRIADGAEVAVL
ncbi:MOSC domain-containing protein [Jannaschia sp. Os4]|uniref:MOSC domain-containing protein n=1 Tax=Jannaschia sp. Os4 TaxID=2807617 RepID=UPI0019394AE4|nr:MOSC domain-containing protein [Jannaschia sp. Os4]